MRFNVFAIVLPPKFSGQKILNSEQSRQAKYATGCRP